MTIPLLLAGKRPTIDWSFLGALPSSLTYARASSGTYFGVDGLLKTAANNEPRFEYDPVTHEPLGLLMEQQSTNSLLRSQDFTAWGWGQTGSPIRTNNESGAPDGSDTWNRFTRTTTSPSYVSRSVIKPAASTPAVLSFYAKKGSVGNYVAVRIQGVYPSRVDAVFNLDAGTTGNIIIGGSGFSGASSGIKHIGNGVYRCWLAISTSDTKDSFYLALSANSIGSPQVNVTDTAADSNAYFWGMQVELNATRPSSYIPTIDTPVTRAADSLSTTNIPWFNPAQGSMFVEFESSEPSLHIPAEFNDGSYNNRIWFEQDGSNTTVYSSMMSGGESIGYINTHRPSIGVTSFKLATSYGTVRDAANNGVLGTRDTTVILPTGIGTLSLGGRGSSYVINGHLRSFEYYNRALPDQELMRITT